MFYSATYITMLLIAASYLGVNTEDCSPEGQTIIKCTSVSGYAKCQAANEIIQHGMPPLSGVNIEEPVVFMNDENKNGVDISWRSPNVNELNRTVGYIVEIVNDSTSRVELCYHYQFERSAVAIESILDNPVFTLHVNSLSTLDTQYGVEITSLPHTNLPQRNTAYSSFITDQDLTPTPGPTTLIPYTINTTVDTSTPFSVTVWFRRTSFYDSHIIDIYNHKFYNTNLLSPDKRHMGDINGITIPEKKIPTSTTEEYAMVIFNNILPGDYIFEVFPYIDNPRNPGYFKLDEDNIHRTVPFSSRGTDYDPPNRPILEISKTNNITVTFYVAPSSHLIESYEIRVNKLTAGTNSLTKLYHLSGKKTWQTDKIFFSADEVGIHFKHLDEIRAQVIPKVKAVLCEKAGICNIKGTCVACNESVSLTKTINGTCVTCKESVSPKEIIHDTSVSKAWLAPVAGSIGALFVIIIVLVLAVKYVRSNNDCVIPYSRSRNMGCKYPMVKEGKAVQPKVALSYIADSTYGHLNETLRETLERHFQCEVVIYTGTQDPSIFKGCDYILVLYSWPLLEVYRYFEERIVHQITEELKERQQVLNLLLQPQPPESPPVLMAVFDHVPVGNMNVILDRNSELGLYKLPSQIKQLATCLSTPHYENPNQVGENRAMLRNWSKYENSELEESLNKAIDDVAKYDSGFDTMTLKTIESHPFDTVSVLAESTNPPLPVVKEQRPEVGYANYSPDRTITINTTTPYAEEKHYFHSRLDSTEPLAEPTQSPADPTQPPPPFSPHYTNPIYSTDQAIMIGHPIVEPFPSQSIINESKTTDVGKSQESQKSGVTSGLSSLSFPSDPRIEYVPRGRGLEDSDSVLTVDSTIDNPVPDDSLQCSTVCSSRFTSNIESSRTTYDV